MAKTRKITPTSGKMQNNRVIVHHQPQQRRLITINRYLIAAVFILMTAVFMLGLFIFPNGNDIVEALKNKQQSIITTKTPLEMNAEIDSLKRELVGVVSGSIERRLNSLEEGIKLGSVLGSLQTLTTIRHDIKVLHGYSEPLKQKQQQIAQANLVLIEEVSHLRGLIYLTLGSCGLMFTAFVLIWVKNRKYFLNYEKDNHYLLKSAKESEE
ncbi:MAG: hypothetical protein Q9M50_10115 [Methylococcales bacterium]|nr:hypothetical protein [Methylococcales bacterium]